MMRKTKVAIVGRPNVGKSSLFNRLTGKRMAIVAEEEGVTRDRLYAPCEAFGSSFDLIDTGGLRLDASIDYWEKIRIQTEIAVEEADILVMVVDGTVGLLDQEAEIARRLLQTEKPVFLAVNKIDNEEREVALSQFYSLAIDKMHPISSLHGHGIADLLEEIQPYIHEGEEEEKGIKLGIVGRTNVGKSTLVNSITGEERCVVSDSLATTRDRIDITVERDGEPFVIIDTAGLRKKKKESSVVEKFAAIRTQQVVKQCDVAVVLIDAEEKISSLDTQLLHDLHALGKGVILFVNKWDTISHTQMEHWRRDVRIRYPFLKHVPIICGSALQKRNIDEIFSAAKQLYKKNHQDISTSTINQIMTKAMNDLHPPFVHAKRLRVYYATQVGRAPIRIALFVNHKHLMTRSYEKYLINTLKRELKIQDIPLFLHIKPKKSSVEHTPIYK